MNQTDVSWPTAPTGIAPVGRVSDPELRELARLLREDSTSQWFERVKPPKNPHPTVTKLPDYDHEEELAAVPEEPTENYRKQALEYVEGVIEARDSVRPDSLQSASELPDGISRSTSRGWVWYHTTDSIQERTDDRPRSLAETTDHGKYLFFTPDDTGVLEDIIVEQFQSRPFDSAKVPTILNRKPDAVLCLYYSDDRYRADLRETYQNEPEDDTYGVASPYNPEQPIIKPRGFKTDSATRRNEYSDEFRQESE